MAEKRMFAKSIVLTDAFLDMPASARCLYFTLAMAADDDGFVGSPKSVMRQCRATEDDLLILLSKRYVLGFESGVLVIKHWRIHNTIQGDRYHPTTYQEEYSMLTTDKKKGYVEATAQLPEQCFQTVSNMETERIQDGIPDKIRLDKTSIDEKREEPAHKYGEFGWVKLTDKQYEKLLQDLGEKELKRCIRYVDESAQATHNRNGWTDWNLTIRKCSRDRWGLDRKEQKPKQYMTAENYKTPQKIDTAQLDKIRQAFAGCEGMEM